MMADIDGNLRTFLADRLPEARYASFDYCYNHFQQAREAKQITRLADQDHLMLSCLQLGFYLASWGMMRGSGDLLYRSVRDLVPVVEKIAAEPADVWNLSAGNLATDADAVLALSHRIRTSFTIPASDVLVTKTILGVFGCVPAFDRYFRLGFGCSTLCKDALVRIGRYYTDNQVAIDAHDIRTLDFDTGLDTERRYPTYKIIDMVFFQEDLNVERHRRRARTGIV